MRVVLVKLPMPSMPPFFLLNFLLLLCCHLLLFLSYLSYFSYCFCRIIFYFCPETLLPSSLSFPSFSRVSVLLLLHYPLLFPSCDFLMCLSSSYHHPLPLFRNILSSYEKHTFTSAAFESGGEEREKSEWKEVREVREA